ncbi:MAG TPA: carboxypeptidase-like regulatory domain-containing protein [Verrucomicrobiae bacterium]|nr:carboxypeptidase-like regulatory domain-containing protein [Verrucomicrobiae bacterium]
MDLFTSHLGWSTKPKEVNLTKLHIASPCPANWEKMIGDERVRHCSECNLNIYNISAMAEAQAIQLIAKNQGQRVCLRLYRRADGTVMTQDCPWSLRAMTRKISRLAAAVLTAIMSVTIAMAKGKPQPATCECTQSQQKESGIKLIVVDQHGAVIPKAEITLIKQAAKEAITGITGDSGEWNRPSVAAGQYQITVTSPGFRKFSSVIDVREEALLRLKVKLPVADVNVTVEVKAEPMVVMGTSIGVLTEVHDSLPLPVATAGQHFPMRP